MMDFYFKKTFGGMVLMRKDRRMVCSPGIFEDYWRKATEKESQEFISFHEALKEQAILVEELKKEKPEYFI